MKMNTQPFVSVIMPVYNGQDFVVAAIDSILAQTYTHFELIIIDDASTDTTPEILRNYQRLYPKKIKIIRMKKNLNCGGDMCANEALKYATGTYIARMDADDIAHPLRLEKQVGYLEKHPQVYLVGSNAFVINKEGKIIGEKKEPAISEAIYKGYCTFHPLIHPSLMIRRVSKGVPFHYLLKYSANNDYYTFFKLLCEGKQFVNLQENLLYYRIHGKNDTFVHVKKKFMNTVKIRLAMVFAYGYKPTLRDIATTIVQSMILFSLPEAMSTKLYLFSKGIIRPQNPLTYLPLFLRREAVQEI